MTQETTRRGFTREEKNVVICPPCGESTLKGGKGVVNKETLMDNPPSVLRTTSPASGEGNKAFTLIELLVVVLVIGILAAVALPQYNRAVKKAKGAEVLEAANVLDKALSSYYLTHGNYKGSSSTANNFLPGPSADELDIAIPELKYFGYGYPPSGTPISSTFQIGCSTDPKYDNVNISFIEKSGDVKVGLRHFKGKKSMECAANNGPIEHCGDYFNCQWDKITWSPCADPTRLGCPIVTTKHCYLN